MPADDQQMSATTGPVPGGSPHANAGDPSPVDGQLKDVDDALGHLAELPIAAQVAVFTDLHQRLTAALAVTASAAGVSDEPPQHRPGQPPHRNR